MVDADGGPYLLGGIDGGFLPKPGTVVGAAAPDSQGIWLAANDGNVYSVGTKFAGSAAGLPLVAPIVGIAAAP